MRSLDIAVRNRLCELATQDSDWVSVCPWGIASGPRTAEGLQNLLTQTQVHDSNDAATTLNITVMEICGADHAMRLNLMRRSQLLVISRPPHSDDVQRKIDEQNPKLFLVRGQEVDISSTAIRRHLENKHMFKVVPLSLCIVIWQCCFVDTLHRR
jgi:nicotinic acid mononucleotide adenylyltransferase